MARIEEITRDRADDEQRRVGDAIFGSRHEDYGGPSAIMLHVPELTERFDHLRNYLVREQQLPNRLLQMAVLVTVRFWSAQYAWWKRVEQCRDAGVPDDVIEAVRHRRRPPFQDGDLEAVYDYTTELLQHRKVSDEAHRRLHALIGDEQLIELVTAVGFYSMLCLVCDAFEPDLPEGMPPPLDP